TVGTGVQDVEALERSRFTAMTAQDVGALEPMLADDLVYCHSNGACETKAQFLETIHSGRIRYQVMKVLELRPRAVGGDAVVVNGSVAVDGLMGGQARSFTIVFTDVYAQRSGRWQLTAWQSTQLP
ncbi:MAG TPA: nuclear transport factor 2 family protein, partial [Steroidobacteraceae bacterium]|nr:nuclear transport factor 2 family protein [Steroidobacteraceae bacterium]